MGLEREDRLDIKEQDRSETAMEKAGVSYDGLIDDIYKLKQLLLQETALLKRGRFNEVKAMHDGKLRLIRRVEIQKDLLKRHKEQFGAMDDGHRRVLSALNQELQGVLRENYQEAAVAKEVNRMVVNCVMRAVSQKRQAVGGYNASGRNMEVTAGRASNDTVSLAVNETI